MALGTADKHELYTKGAATLAKVDRQKASDFWLDSDIPSSIVTSLPEMQ